MTDRQLIELGDGGALAADGAIPFPVRFERVAREAPDAVAVVASDETLTYAELSARSDAVARSLRSIGVGREQVVGICLPRRLDVLIAILGVLKSGAAYLPLDLVQPVARRRFMLADAGAAALITESNWAEELTDGRIPALTAADWRGERGGGRPWQEPALEDLAYVIYTSGSTGQPKGVMIEHRSLAAYVEWGVSNFSREELAGVFMATSFGFDMSLFEFTVPLAAGGRIVLADNFFELPRMAHHGLTLVNAVPSLMAAALNSGIELPESVHTAVFCGETLPFEVSEAVHRQPGITRLVNTYGPTEDTVYSTGVDVARGERPTIGRPFPGTQAYVVDEDMRLVPRGEAGELCLAGVGLARGYKGRDELTDERFVPNPFDQGGSGRLYRTGDLARWEPDGSLQHLGRLDHQIKLRGVRIEPGDIEESLLRHPHIRQAVVVARERPAGGKWLVGYIVCDDDDAVGDELRDMLRETLPEPMVPALFVKLPELPLNANGKLDRARLPEPEVTGGASAPATDTEQLIAELWRELLALEHLPGRDDDYFELGGDSLTAFEFFVKVETHIGRDFSPTVLLEASTVCALADLIDAGVERGRLVPLNAGGSRVPVAYVQSGAGGMLSLRTLTAAFGPDQPLYGIQAFDDTEVEAGNILGIEQTAAECLAALRAIQPEGPYILAGHSIGGHIAFEMATRLEREGEDVLLLALVDPPAPYTLRPRMRLVARALELTGVGPEPRRRGVLKAVVNAAVGRVRARARGGTETVYGMQYDSGPSAWMRHLTAIERGYEPGRFSGHVIAYTTADSARYTGSRTLGWHRYVDGPVETRRVPGGHVTMLVPPNVEVLASALDADVRAAQPATQPAAA